MAKLDSLIVDLQVNTAELRKGLDEANKKLEGFGAKLNDLAGVIVFEKMAKVAGQAVKGLVEFALRGAESVDRMNKMAQGAGVGVENFSRLAYAFELGGVGSEELGAAMVKLNKNISEAATGSKEQAALFGALGIKVTDASGKVRSADAVIKDIADRFAKFADGASKSTLAADLFGKMLGAQLIPTLNGGSQAIDSLGKESDRLGITINSGAAAAAEAFNDNLQKLKMAAQAVGQHAAAELAPALTKLSDQLLKSSDSAETLRMAGEGVGGVLKVLASIGVLVAAAFEAVGKTIARVASAVVSAATGNFSAALEDLKGQFTDLPGVAKDALKRWGAIWGDSAEAAKEGAKAHGKSADAIAAALERMKKAAIEAESAMKTLTKVALDYEAKVSGFGAGPLAELQGRLDKGDLAAALAKIGDKAAAMRDRIMEAAKALEALKAARIDEDQAAERSRASAAMTASIRERRQENLLGPAASPLERAQFHTRGFADFDSALDEMAKQTRIRLRQLDEASNLERSGKQADIEAARQLRLTADEAGRAAAAADKAADAFVEVAKETLAKQKEIVSMALNVLSSIGEHGAEISQLANSAMQGFQAGGLWGAIIAVIANLFAKLEAIGTFVDKLFENFMKGFEQLNGSMDVLFGSLTQSLEPAMKGLEMAFGFINKVLVPIFAAMENMMKPFEDLADGLLGLLESTGILGFVIKAIAGVFNVVSLVILGITYGIQTLWAGVLQIVRGVIAIFTLGQGTAEIDATIAQHAANMADTKARLERVASNLLDPNAATDAGQGTHGIGELPRVTDQVGNLGNAADTAAENLNKFSASLTNVPQGFKYAARAFEATRAAGSWQGGREGSNAGLTVIVQGHVISEDELASILGDFQSRNQFRRRGISFAGNTR